MTYTLFFFKQPPLPAQNCREETENYITWNLSWKSGIKLCWVKIEIRGVDRTYKIEFFRWWKNIAYNLSLQEIFWSSADFQKYLSVSLDNKHHQIKTLKRKIKDTWVFQVIEIRKCSSWVSFSVLLQTNSLVKPWVTQASSF